MPSAGNSSPHRPLPDAVLAPGLATGVTSPPGARSRASSIREFLLVMAVAAGLTALMTWPLVTDPGGLGRLRLNDGRWSIWVVSWVAHAITSNPLQILNANIFYPHPRALLMSEPNFIAGLLGAPAWILTGNPLLTHNVALLMAFVLAGGGTYYLARRVTANRTAAAVAAIIFAFSPYMFAHTAHIQLEMTAGLPLVLLMIHRHADQPSVRRGAAIGLAVAVQTLACGYYGVLTALVAPAAMVFFAVSRGLWRSRPYWSGAAAGAATAALVAVPLFLPYLDLRNTTGFTRGLADSQVYSAVWQSYLASAAWAHRWWLPAIAGFQDVLFPGILAVTLGVAGAWLGFRAPERRELVVFYTLLVILAFWLSLGPAGGLYNVLYESIVVVRFLRAPSRLGLGVILGFAILSAVAVERLAARVRGRWRGVLAAVPLLAVLDLVMIPIAFDPMPRVSAAYRMLGTLPRGVVAEFPFYWRTSDLQHHAGYMLYSTYHWQPMINGYSDIFPPDMGRVSQTLAGFPAQPALDLLRERGTRYLVVHYPRYRPEVRLQIEQQLGAHGEHFRELQRDGDVALYEVVSWPPANATR